MTTNMNAFINFSRKVGSEGAVLLKNDGHVLPIHQANTSVFGRSQINYFRSGTGSGGSVNVSYTTNLLDGLRQKSTISINESLATLYETWIKDHPFDNGGGGWAQEPWHQKEMILTDEIVKDARNHSTHAIVVIGRTAGEDQDNAPMPGSFFLTEDELTMIRIVRSHFEKMVVVLNVSNIIDMNWVNTYSIPCVIYAWQGGMEGGNAIADVLVGDVTPGGKLSDTIAYSIEDYPSTCNYGNTLKNFYQEDIYVGYRYFETFCPEKVHYEFGFGLSYTTFAIEKSLVKFKNDHFEIKITVTNTGTLYSGKEVVELYGEAPQGRLGSPKRVLIAFEKTKSLKPNESQTIDFVIPISNLSKYDDGGITGFPYAYVLEAGLYQLYVGNSVRNTLLIAEHVVNETHLVTQCEQALAPTESFKRLKPGQIKTNGSYEIAYEDVPLSNVSLKERIESRLPSYIPQTNDLGYTLKDVKNGLVTLDAFIGQLTNEDLAILVRGEGMSSPLVTPGTASAFGGLTDKFIDFGLPVACCADGPSGIRMDHKKLSTQIPIGTLLASTWNKEVIEQLYTFVGQEMLENHIDCLLGPGMNIHRSPLNGRNFEYFSEDPLLTGILAKAVTLGIKKSGASSTLKHFACNNQEKSRNKVDAIVSERALREIYLKGFEIVVLGGADAVMTSYNPINGHWAASNYDLNTTLLRNEWGFKGIVMTDWWAVMNDVVTGGPASIKNTRDMIRAQNDLYMVVANYGAETNIYGDHTLQSIEQGTLTIGELQRNAKNICQFLLNSTAFTHEQKGEPIPHIKPLKAMILNQPIVLNQNKILIKNESQFIHIKESGNYRIYLQIQSEGTRLSQTSCQIYMNDQIVSHLQFNGSEGESRIQKANKVNLEKGIYEVKLTNVHASIHIEWMEFINC